MSETSTLLSVPGYVAGRWNVDATHSEVGFSVRHMMVSKVRGKFTKYEVEVVTGENPLESSVTASIDLNSIDTGQPDRDNHLRSADFFEVETYPTMTYRSTGIRQNGDDFILDGELTLKGVTKPVSLALELGGFGPDPFGAARVPASPPPARSCAATSTSTSTPPWRRVESSWATRSVCTSRSKRCSSPEIAAPRLGLVPIRSQPGPLAPARP